MKELEDYSSKQLS